MTVCEDRQPVEIRLFGCTDDAATHIASRGGEWVQLRLEAMVMERVIGWMRDHGLSLVIGDSDRGSYQEEHSDHHHNACRRPIIRRSILG